ncbi:MAG: 2-oxoacid:acceptor oxidoreductase family protein [Nitrososphaera sp.]|jgi:pyruvate ferredoxin oxidoreductase gamma subunit
MITRVSLIGRGGQGIKSAAHIIGTAAFLAGYAVQDQPLYGAERRGAPITAFIRISDEPVILERGHAIDPAILVIADESLLDDTLAGSVETMLSSETVLFVSTDKTAAELQAKYSFLGTLAAGNIISANLARRSEEILGAGGLVASAVSGVTAKLLGLGYAELEKAVRFELSKLGVSGERLEGNVNLARATYQSVQTLPEVTGLQPPRRSARPEEIIALGYQGPALSACTITAPGNTASRKVGNWSLYKPLIDYDRCTKCMICFVYCPDSAISIRPADRLPSVNYNACKGCDICYTECPVKAISLVRRENA